MFVLLVLILLWDHDDDEGKNFLSTEQVGTNHVVSDDPIIQVKKKAKLLVIPFHGVLEETRD